METERRTQEIGHMAWCGLIALALARCDKRISSVMQENLFLTSWLATALKQHRFSRAVAEDIEWLVKKGRTQGMQAKLASKLEYLWRSCAGDMLAQSDLFRLTAAVETAKDKGWNYRLLTDRDWADPSALFCEPGAIYLDLSRSLLERAFDEDGSQCAQMYIRSTGHVSQLSALIAPFGWHVTEEITPEEGLYVLMASEVKPILQNNEKIR